MKPDTYEAFRRISRAAHEEEGRLDNMVEHSKSKEEMAIYVLGRQLARFRSEYAAIECMKMEEKA